MYIPISVYMTQGAQLYTTKKMPMRLGGTISPPVLRRTGGDIGSDEALGMDQFVFCSSDIYFCTYMNRVHNFILQYWKMLVSSAAQYQTQS